MRQFIIASHAHFAAGINESVSLLSGERDNVRTLSMYVDGNNDLAAAAAKMLDETPEGDDLVVCTDLFGGSVNNEFTSIVQRRPNTYLVTNMNLPLLIQLLFAEEGHDTAEVIREICAADDTRVKFVNDLIEDTEDDEEF
ncbi:MAG: PTS fructose transporter subunit IIA [Collinsella stercoris]|uniref:PTS sugar transporter subunit IIA n=1 Tax=Collinsella stercoris TaxID=147206 RepID=UPI0023F23275|nr:PTS fructose transporter subunit IIA [Collinsella stercoris]MBS5499552.1 PTS fructose transporter subunit IIA [Collinsella stercoris]MEE0475376.1 PTS fructose transporter subunit IIA [Collinsella stercoris]